MLPSVNLLSTSYEACVVPAYGRFLFHFGLNFIIRQLKFNFVKIFIMLNDSSSSFYRSEYSEGCESHLAMHFRLWRQGAWQTGSGPSKFGCGARSRPMSAVMAILVDTLSPGAGSVLKLLVEEKVMPSPTLPARALCTSRKEAAGLGFAA